MNYEDEIFFKACRVGDINSVKNYLSLIINAEDQLGCSGLHLAITSKHLNLVTFLCENGADVEHKSIAGYTPLMRAVVAKNGDLVEVLLKYGANIDIKDDIGRTAYDMAIDNYDVLYAFNKEIIVGSTGISFLSEACKIKNEENILFMYDKGVDFYIENDDGESALTILMSHDELPAKLESLKDKLLLEQFIEEQNELSL